jgi:hypothetical protein
LFLVPRREKLGLGRRSWVLNLVGCGLRPRMLLLILLVRVLWRRMRRVVGGMRRRELWCAMRRGFGELGFGVESGGRTRWL